MQNDTDKCRLVSEEKGITFDLVKVETSNAYVLVKDESNDEAANANASDEEKGGNTEARLLREKNTFFLECLESKVNLESEIQLILREYVYPTVKEGISVNELSSKLMHSKKQIQDTLDKTNAFKFQSAETNSEGCSYGILSEETEREVWFVIQGVLAEWSGGADYAGKGVDLSQMVKEVLNRDDDEDHSYGTLLEESVVRHCLEKCSVEVIDGCAKLSVDYIARILAHYIFNLQTAPWEQKKFIETWHNLMPGVGGMYEPKLDVLQGISVTVSEVSPMETNESAQVLVDEKEPVLYQKYFPIQSLPTTQEGRFKALFKERKRWKFDDLEPYLEDLVENSSFKTTQELLVVFARVAQKEKDDEDCTDWYVAK